MAGTKTHVTHMASRVYVLPAATIKNKGTWSRSKRGFLFSNTVMHYNFLALKKSTCRVALLKLGEEHFVIAKSYEEKNNLKKWIFLFLHVWVISRGSKGFGLMQCPLKFLSPSRQRPLQTHSFCLENAKQQHILHKYLVKRGSSSILKLSFTATSLSPLPSPLKKQQKLKKLSAPHLAMLFLMGPLN